MFKALALAVVLLGASSSAADSSLGNPPITEECCKICRKGKACGDTCIARDKECRTPPGCACDA
jgi:hypothetical protein